MMSDREDAKAVWDAYVVDTPQSRIDPAPVSYQVVVERGLRIPMRDGTELAGVLWRPDAPGQFPVLVERGPHRLEERTGPAGEYHAARGIAVLSVGVRGCAGSGGELEGLIPGSPTGDGYDTIEWSAVQRWCNGRVGMICGSISGLTQYQTAVEAPPHLVALLVREGMFSLGTSDQRGKFSLLARQSVAVAWTNLQLDYFPPERQAKAQALVARWQQEWQHARERASTDSRFVPVTNVMEHLPIYPNPLFAGAADYYNDWIVADEQHDRAVATFPESNARQVKVPICHLGGWYDALLPHVLRAFITLQADGGTPEVRAAQRLIVGPWVHGPTETHGNPVALLEFGPNAKLDFLALRQRWYAAHLQGQGNLRDDPVVWLYLVGADQWLGFATWPPPALPNTWYLHTSTLAQEPPQAEQAPDIYIYDPNDPVRSLAGGGAFGIGLDQRPVEHRLLTYTSPPLAEALTVVGTPTVALYAASSAPDTDWIVRLTLVKADGTSMIISGGAQRARFRTSMHQPQLLEPDKPERFELSLFPLAMVIPAGTRLRLTVTSSDFPNFDRNLNTDEPFGREVEARIATNRILHDADHPSSVTLPLLNAI